MKVLARIAVSVAVATVVWLVAPRAALAAAPLCDARGAITFAPPPTLDEPNASVDIGEADDCSSGAADFALDHGRAPNAPSSVDSIARASLSTPLVVMPATPTAKISPLAQHFDAPSGVRHSVDRPPRG